MITTLIVDDEPLTRNYLRQALEAQGVSVLGEAADGVLALQLAEDLCPDLVLLDLDLRAPGLTGLQIGSALFGLVPVPLVAYLAGSSQHAVAAFEHGAMDYLLKPVAPHRLAKMVARARGRLTDQRARRAAEQRAAECGRSAPRVRVPVWAEGATRLLRLEEIDGFEAREKQVYARAGGTEYRTDWSLSQLEAALPAGPFFRLHHAHLVKLERVEELLFLGNHRYAVRLSDQRVLPVGRRAYPALRQRLGLDRMVERASGTISPQRVTPGLGSRSALCDGLEG